MRILSTIARVVSLLVLLALIVGFGACGAMGLVFGSSGRDLGIIGLGLLGIAIAVGLGFVVRIVIRSFRRPQG